MSDYDLTHGINRLPSGAPESHGGRFDFRDRPEAAPSVVLSSGIEIWHDARPTELIAAEEARTAALRNMYLVQEAGVAAFARELDSGAHSLDYELQVDDAGTYYGFPTTISTEGSYVEIPDEDVDSGLPWVGDERTFRKGHPGDDPRIEHLADGTIRVDIDATLAACPEHSDDDYERARDAYDEADYQYRIRQEDYDRELDEQLIGRIKGEHPDAVALRLETDWDEDGRRYVSSMTPVDAAGGPLGDEIWDDALSTTDVSELEFLYRYDRSEDLDRLTENAHAHDGSYTFRFEPSGPPVKAYKGYHRAMDAEVIRKLGTTDPSFDVDSLAREWIVKDPATGKYRARSDDDELFWKRARHYDRANTN